MIPFHAELVPQDFLTFDAWIKPDMDVKGEVIAMMGTWGWGPWPCALVALGRAAVALT